METERRTDARGFYGRRCAAGRTTHDNENKNERTRHDFQAWEIGAGGAGGAYKTIRLGENGASSASGITTVSPSPLHPGLALASAYTEQEGGQGRAGLSTWTKFDRLGQRRFAFCKIRAGKKLLVL